MKIYITGSVGSGKSTLARRVSKLIDAPCYHLDELMYIEDPTDSWGNKKRDEEERSKLFHNILDSSCYVMEDAGRECFLEGVRQADVVIILEIPLYIRRKRILTRWLKQKLGLERCIYKPHFGMLKAMFRWAMNYDTDADGTKSRIAPYHNKAIILRNNKEIEQYLHSFKTSYSK